MIKKKENNLSQIINIHIKTKHPTFKFHHVFLCPCLCLDIIFFFNGKVSIFCCIHYHRAHIHNKTVELCVKINTLAGFHVGTL